MKAKLPNKQRIRLFLANVLAFALVFFALGVIVLQVLSLSAYRETDQQLTQTTSNSPLIQLEIQRYQENDPTLRLDVDKRFKDDSPKPMFNNQVILWSKDGQILNKEALGSRYAQFESLTLNTKELDSIQTLQLEDQASNTSDFRSVIRKAPDNNSDIAYVQILANTNQIKSALTNFKAILVVCMVIFWFLSIGISYILASLSMRPIVASWKRQQEFVENASHELRTPLAIIQNSLQHLFTKPNQTILEESESIAQALAETRRLTGLTNDLLTIARNDSNQQVVEYQEVALQPFLEELLRPFQEMAQLDGKQLLLQPLEDPEQTWSFDRKKIHQVLVILLDNALKYTKAQDQIFVVTKTTSKDWRVMVINTGPGIADKDKEHLFDRFYREDHSRAKETGGYGLGLAIAKQLIQEHHGDITVKDFNYQNQIGVTFEFKLPKK